MINVLAFGTIEYPPQDVIMNFVLLYTTVIFYHVTILKAKQSGTSL